MVVALPGVDLWCPYRVGVSSDQKLVDTGPYSRLMHPGYTGLILQQLGMIYFIGLKQSPKLFVLYGLLGSVGMTRRILNEEKELEAHFGREAFTKYKQTRWRLIPYIF